ncbi:MAG: class I SAM-dependent methyltransferase [Rhodothermales bacterium]|nr:class I SAM-dependent methyltransferase [Rhodothermales bacterium]
MPHLPPTDPSNGYDALSAEFIAARDRSTIGVASVRAWARTLPPGAAVLELGCGHGVPISEALVDEGVTLFGLDASPRMIAAFRTRLPGVEAVCSPVEDSDFFGRTFDGVVAWGLFFLLSPAAQETLIHRVAASLHPGGSFLFTSPGQRCEWQDVLTGQVSVSLGSEAYRRVVEAAGLALAYEANDEGENHYYVARR